MRDNPSGNTLERFFHGLAEYVFQAQLGVADPPLTDYLGGLLLRFVRWDAVHKVRGVNGRPIKYLGEMLVEADARIGEARREVHQHIGDFTLFWTGLYPESLRGRRGHTVADQYGDYCVHGKRAYLIASSIEVDEQASPSNEVLQRLAHQFEMCAYGLREVRREWERREGDEGRLQPLWTR
ncbi:MAG: hypothetical protein J5I93_06785 [Pirellulaceae bacterium]|nr:hypothetical protein [Pirellulaceae bacterium]